MHIDLECALDDPTPAFVRAQYPRFGDKLAIELPADSLVALDRQGVEALRDFLNRVLSDMT